jgi:hypothetical protein
MLLVMNPEFRDRPTGTWRRLFGMLVVSAVLAHLRADAPRFDGPYDVYDGGMKIDVGSYGAPVMTDWNGDGRKDLICGQFDSGKVRFYPNLGPDSAPRFDGFSFLRADGVEITLDAI